MSEANPKVGEADFRGLKLRMDFDRFAQLEQLTGKKMPRLLTEFEMGLGLADLLAWFRCLVVGDVPVADIKAAIHQGGMMADYEAANKVVGELLNGFFQPEDKAKKARPQTAE